MLNCFPLFPFNSHFMIHLRKSGTFAMWNLFLQFHGVSTYRMSISYMSLWPYSFIIKLTKLTKRIKDLLVSPHHNVHVFLISIWKFGIRLGYYNNILRLNLCFSYAYTNLNLKYDFKDSYSGILYYFNTMFSFSFFSMKTVHNQKHYITARKKHRFWQLFYSFPD